MVFPVPRVKNIVLGLAAVVLVGLAATPAHAQFGAAKGRVFDDKAAVNDAEVTLVYLEDKNIKPLSTLTANDRSVGGSKGGGGGSFGGGAGWWNQGGLRPGKWSVTARKGNLVGTAKYPVVVSPGEVTMAVDITLKFDPTAVPPPPKPAGANVTLTGDIDPAKASQAEIDKKNERLAALSQMFTDANAAIAAGNFDLAVEKMNAAKKEVEKCAPCETTMGNIHLKKGEMDLAEASYKASIDIDPKQAAPYASLATIYNQQGKLDEAAKMSQKAGEIQAAAGGVVNAETLYNQGVILWNQGKGAEAQPLFEKATQLDPKMAEAFYLLGMTLVNQNKLADAKKPFNEYLKLAPKGPNADTVKAILATIK